MEIVDTIAPTPLACSVSTWADAPNAFRAVVAPLSEVILEQGVEYLGCYVSYNWTGMQQPSLTTRDAVGIEIGFSQVAVATPGGLPNGQWSVFVPASALAEPSGESVDVVAYWAGLDNSAPYVTSKFNVLFTNIVIRRIYSEPGAAGALLQ